LTPPPKRSVARARRRAALPAPRRLRSDLIRSNRPSERRPAELVRTDIVPGLPPPGYVVREIVIARDTVSVSEWCGGAPALGNTVHRGRFATIDAHGGIAQLVEHTTENRGVPGSSPGLATILATFEPPTNEKLSGVRAFRGPPLVRTSRFSLRFERCLVSCLIARPSVPRTISVSGPPVVRSSLSVSSCFCERANERRLD
jgi:hypothetical protein